MDEPLAHHGECGMVRRLGWSVAAAAAAVFVSAAIYSAVGWEWTTKPDRWAMRQHRVSLLSDEQLLNLRREAEDEVANFRRQDELAQIRARKDRSSRLEECNANPAIKLRNPASCAVPIDFGSSLRVPSADEQFEINLMGMCLYARNIREAKEYNCLPR